MKLEKIITLANEPVRLRFLAMERSLRATGCDLPLWVIPYDDRRFELPPNAHWWTNEPHPWLQQNAPPPSRLKFQCLTEANYQFVDSDLVFLKNPIDTLAPVEGFITSCGHWHNPDHAVTTESAATLKTLSTCWQRNVFNTGQFASDRPLYSPEELKHKVQDPRYRKTCLDFPFHEQPGLVLLANLSGVPIHNLTLPPTNMESTWAGDYAEEGFDRYWQDEARKPYLIHWAGCAMWQPRAIDRLFTQYLTATELDAWKETVAAQARRDVRDQRAPRTRLRKLIRRLRAS